MSGAHEHFHVIQAATTMPSVIILLIKIFFFAVLFMGITYTFSFSFLPRIPVGRTKRTMIRTENTIASESWKKYMLLTGSQ